MMTLKEYTRNNYATLQRISDAEFRDMQIAAVQYIESLASQTQTDVDGWGIDEVFGVDEGSRQWINQEIITGKNEINRRFFERKAIHDLAAAEGPAAFTEAIEKTMTDGFKRYRKDAQDNMRQEARDSRGIISDSVQSISVYMKKIVDIESALHFFATGEKVDIVGNLKAALAAVPFFGFEGFDRTAIRLFTAADIILEEKNPSANLHTRVNLGRFNVVLRVSGMQVQCFPRKGNVKAHGHHHPHLSQRGYVCWGDALGSIRQASAKGDITHILRTLANILTTYSRDNPHQPLYEFQVAANAPAPTPGDLEARARDVRGRMVDWGLIPAAAPGMWEPTNQAELENQIVPAFARPAIDLRPGQILPLESLEGTYQISLVQEALETDLQLDDLRSDNG